MHESNATLGKIGLRELNAMKSTRRRWLLASLSSMTFLSYLPSAVDAMEPQALGADEQITKLTRVKSVLEVKGNVKLKNYQSKKAGEHRSASIEAKSTLEYEEEFRIGASLQSTVEEASYQAFSIAELDNLIEKHATKISLREPCREIIKKEISGRRSTVCVGHPLTSAERDLVEGPISTMFLERLMPSRAIKLGDQWELDNESASKLFNLDLATKGTIRVTLVDADADVGQIELKGTLQGEVRSIGTKIEIEGKAKIDRKQGIVTWCTLAIQEDREVSEAEPGFQIQARIRILRESIDAISSGRNLSEMETHIDQSSSGQLTQIDSRLGAYRFVADRDWTTYNDSGVDAALRWVQKNRTIAQCTITNLTDMEPGRQLTLAGFQNDIQKSLDKRFGQFSEADERLSQTGLRMMRVVTMGQVETVPIQWIHILLSNDAGRHLSLAYSMNASNADSFGTQDLQMAGSLEFTLKQLPVAPSESKSEDSKSAEAKAATKPATTAPRR